MDLERVPLAAAYLDPDGRVLSFNKAFEEACPDGLEKGVDFLALISDADRPRAARLLGDKTRDKIKEDKIKENLGMIAARLRGSGHAFHLYAGAPDESAARLLCLVGSEPQSSLETFSAQAQKMQAVGQMAGGVAHDFNNLLTAILGACDLAGASGDSPALREIRQSAERGSNLVRQLLAFSRKQTLKPERLHMAEAIENMRDLLSRLLGSHIEVSLRADSNLWHVRADRTEWERVFLNLAVNARDAIDDLKETDGEKPRAALRIRLSNFKESEARALDYALMPPADYVLCEVSDTGGGIPSHALGSIFEPFFSTRQTGSGLGLSTVYGIVKQTGGFIFADNAPSGGARFRIYIPRFEGAEGGERKNQKKGLSAPQQPARATRPARAVRPARATRPACLLLVEDDDAVRRFALQALRAEGHEVIGARDASEALAKPIESVDVVITDLMMPGMDGLELLKRLRLKKPDLLAILISGYADRAFRKTPQTGDVLFLPKPFGLSQLRAVVGEALANRRGAEA